MQGRFGPLFTIYGRINRLGRHALRPGMLLLRHIFVAVPSTAGDEARESARNSEVMITAEGAGAISGKIPCFRKMISLFSF
jgi:hypothetical protein